MIGLNLRGLHQNIKTLHQVPEVIKVFREGSKNAFWAADAQAVIEYVHPNEF